MNLLIVGCGKVGVRLAGVLSREGHDVSVVDRLQENLDQLPADYAGFKTCGIPIDQDVLRQAGIESCDALAAVTGDDNVNIMVSQLARDLFHVETVLARIDDPVREEVFSQFGLQTICSTNLTVSAICSAIVEQERPARLHIGNRTISFSTEVVPPHLAGELANDLDLAENQSLYGIIRKDSSLVLYQGQALTMEEGDTVILSTLVD